jgi:phosphoribosylaminoimidazolecarboxamide formyltransferase/IMP cyclohydrolase
LFASPVPFRETIAKEHVTFEEAIENIDIGGPTMVRSAAKNHNRVTIVVNPGNYKRSWQAFRKNGCVPLLLRKRLAAEAFAHTAEYDRLIAGYLEGQIDTETCFPQNLRLFATKVQDLRYGKSGSKSGILCRPRSWKRNSGLWLAIARERAFL